MHKVIILSGFVLLCTGCGEVAPTPSPTPTLPTTASIDPRCLMTPTPSMDTTGIICPGGTSGDGRTTTPTTIATPSPTDPTSTPIFISPVPSFTPRAAVTSTDIACLTGHWHQGASEILFQYMQTLSNTPLLVTSGSSIDFNFTRSGNSGTFTQTFNNVVLESSKASQLSRNGQDNYKFMFNGTAIGSFEKRDDGKIYFFDIKPDGVTIKIDVNGEQMLSDASLTSAMLPVYATEVGISCHTTLQLTYNIPGRSTTIYLDRE